MKAVRLNQISKVAGHKNQNNEHQDAKSFRKAEGAAESVIILCGFVTMSNLFLIACSHLTHCVYKNKN